MNEIIKEYGSMLISMAATMGFIALVSLIILNKDSLMAEFIIFWCGGI